MKKNKKNFNKKYAGIFIGFLLLVSIVCVVKAAVNEYDFERWITVDLDGGYSEEMFWRTMVDRDGEGHEGGDWLDHMGAGESVLDRNGVAHSVQSLEGNEGVQEGCFKEHADCVGVTPYVVIKEPSRDWYTFKGWLENTERFEEDGYWYFECGCYANGSGDINITALWERIQYRLSVRKEHCIVTGDGWQDAGTTAELNVEFNEGYMLDYAEDMDTGARYYEGQDPYHWGMYSNRNVRIVSKPISYTVQYNAQDADNLNGYPNPKTEEHTYGEASFQLWECGYTRNGWEFAGWKRINSDGTEIQYRVGQTVRNLSSENGGTVNLYSSWKDKIPPVITVENAEPVEGISNTVEVNVLTEPHTGKGKVNVTAADYESGIDSLTVSPAAEMHQEQDEEKISAEITVPPGSYTFYMTAIDQAGNRTRLTVRVNVLSLTASIENWHSRGSSTFERGDKGILRVQMTGKIEELEIIFPDCFNTDENIQNKVEQFAYPSSNSSKTYYFTIPLYNIEDGEYDVTLKAHKGKLTLEANPVFRVSGTVLNKIKTVIKTSPETDWSNGKE